MIKSRLLSAPEDYKKYGMKKGEVEPWEDGRRCFATNTALEWWYYDAIMEDGLQIALSYHIRSPLTPTVEGDNPLMHLTMKTADGKQIAKYVPYAAGECNFSKEGCDVKIGPHSTKGNLKEYKIFVEPIEGYGVDLTLTSQSTSWRPECGYFVMGDDEEQYFTWLCVVPKGKVSGTITFDGVTREVTGSGYHDHQWTNTSGVTLWNHWVWGRQHYDDYSLMLFDYNHSAQYGYKRYPLFFIQDKDGKLIFENSRTETLKYEYLEEGEPLYGKPHPKVQRYTFEVGGKKAVYTLTAKAVIESSDRYVRIEDSLKKQMDEMGFYPTYTRYLGEGKLVFTDTDGKTIERVNELIYEIQYPSKNFKIFG